MSWWSPAPMSSSCGGDSTPRRRRSTSPASRATCWPRWPLRRRGDEGRRGGRLRRVAGRGQPRPGVRGPRRRTLGVGRARGARAGRREAGGRRRADRQDRRPPGAGDRQGRRDRHGAILERSLSPRRSRAPQRELLVRQVLGVGDGRRSGPAGPGFGGRSGGQASSARGIRTAPRHDHPAPADHVVRRDPGGQAQLSASPAARRIPSRPDRCLGLRAPVRTRVRSTRRIRANDPPGAMFHYDGVPADHLSDVVAAASGRSTSGS